jgi:predicted RNA-binding Zn ribbon-like protein
MRSVDGNEAARSRAPGRLAVVQDLANSFDEVRGRDDLSSSEAAAAWLCQQGLTDGREAFSAGDLAQLRDIRAALRRLCLANNGCERRAEDLETLDAVAASAGLRPRFNLDGSVELEVAGRGAGPGLGRLIGIVYEAMRDGTWRRLKACPEHSCNYAFYDHSRNGSRTWCTMAQCGSRSKMRAYRARLKRVRDQGAGSGPPQLSTP